MKEKIENKIKELNSEAVSLIEERKKLIAILEEIETRLHQIGGAVDELQKILNL